jgi:amino acid permease
MNAHSLLIFAAEQSGPDAGIGQKVATIVVLVGLIGILAYYLVKIAGLLEHILEGLQTTNATVLEIIGHAEPIIPGVERINRILGVIAGALPLLYNLAEKIDNKLTKA